MLPAFGTWWVVRPDLDGRKWKLNYTIMSLGPEASFLCVSKSGVIMKTGTVCTFSSPHIRNPGIGTIHCSRAGVCCRHRSRNQRYLPVYLKVSGGYCCRFSAISVSRWHRALVSTHLLTIPGFWLGLLDRQEKQLTTPATSQETGTEIIDRNHFQLPSWAGLAIIHQQNESTQRGAWDGFLTSEGVLLLLILAEQNDRYRTLPLTWGVKHIYISKALIQRLLDLTCADPVDAADAHKMMGK